MAEHRPWYDVARHHPSAWLLFAQLLGLLLYPLFADSDAGRTLLTVFGIGVLGLAMWLVRRTPGTNWIGGALAVPALALSVAQGIFGVDGLVAWTAGFEAAFYFFAAGSLIAYMLQDHAVSADELFAVGATFTLLAWAFAYLFVLCQAIEPGSFIAAVEPDAPRTWTELLFLSFTSLSSTGLGDVIPVKPFARSLLMLEMFAGVMYVTLVVARLIGLLGARPQPTTHDDHRSI